MSDAALSAWRRINPETVFPFLGWRKLFSGVQMRADLMAGVTGALVVLPQGVAFASIAGMPPQYGLYASIVPTIIAALFGSSWHLVAGPSTTASLVLFAALTDFAQPGSQHYVELAITLGAMAGVIELSLGLFRLGGLVNFISHTVVVGYTAGVGILIMTTQLRNFFGLDIPKTSVFVDALRSTFVNLHHLSIMVTVVAAATLVGGVLSRRYIKRIPYMMPAILAGCVAGVIANAFMPGSVSTVGALPRSLPPLSAPSFSWDDWVMLTPTALAIAIAALNEVVSIGRALAIRSEQRLDVNQEFIGQGLANLIGSFFSGYVVSGSFNRSALNYESGAKSPMSAMFAGVLLAAVLVFAAPLAAYLPHAAMAASLELVGWSLIDQKSLKRIWASGWSERGVLMMTIGVALFIQVQAAILAGVALSLVMYLYRTSNPQLRPRVPDPNDDSRKFIDAGPGAPECPQFRLARLDGSIYFGAVNSFRDAIVAFERERPECKRYGVIMRGVNFIDLAGAEALAIEARRLTARGGALYIINIKERPLEFLERGAYVDEIGRDRVFLTKTKALSEIYKDFDYEICGRCELRVFRECSRYGRAPFADDEGRESRTG
ncbi:MAG: SulP family inorganic anion transporter [Roseiarcus sp.]